MKENSEHGTASYERSIYLELADAGGEFQRDLKSERTFISNPRLNLCLNGHPHEFIQAFQSERGTKDDGLMHRFYAMCPKPNIYLSEDIMKASEIPFGINLLFFFIFKKHQEGIEGVFRLMPKGNFVICMISLELL